MSGAMTREKALRIFDGQVTKEVEAAYRLRQQCAPKLKEAARRLEDALKPAEVIELLRRQQAQPLRDLAAAAVQLAEAYRRINEMAQDEEMLRALPRELPGALKELAPIIQAAKDELRAGKVLGDRAEQQAARRDRGEADTAKQWALWVASLDGAIRDAAAEHQAWKRHDTEVQALAVARDRARLATLRKNPPGTSTLDSLLAIPRGRMFERFDRDHDIESASQALKGEIARDRQALLKKYDAAKAMADECRGIRARLGRLEVAPRDARKALAVLGLPAAAQARLQSALDGSDAALPKALEALARQHGVDAKPAAMVERLRKAGLL